MDTKAVLRKKMKQKLNKQKQSERRKKSKTIQKKLFSQKEFLSARCVMLFVSRGTGEVDTGPIIKKALGMGKKVVLPVTVAREKKIKPVELEDFKKDLKKGVYGIYEPKDAPHKRPVRLKEIDLVIVPGLAFDRKNNRLGHGQGYYDRFLRTLPRSTPKIGLGFRFQFLKNIPATGRDFSLTKVITN